MKNKTNNFNLYFSRSLTLIIIFLSFILNSGNNKFGKYAGFFFLIVSVFILSFTFQSKKAQNKTETNLNKGKINKGIYSYVRYPILLSNILLIIGITLISQNLLLVILDYFTIKLIIEHIEENDKLLFKKEPLYYIQIRDVPKLNILKSIYLMLKRKY